LPLIVKQGQGRVFIWPGFRFNAPTNRVYLWLLPPNNYALTCQPFLRHPLFGG
jgi:hypothetical protein